jgi:hypothetical protein
MMVTAVRANALAPRRDRACPRRRDRMECGEDQEGLDALG